jgi:hypothetical protein
MSEPEPRAIPFEVRSGRFGVIGKGVQLLGLRRLLEVLREHEAL